VDDRCDPSLQKQFLMLSNFGGNPAYDLVRYDLNELPADQPWACLSLATIGSGWTMVRYGQDGIALLTVGGSEPTSCDVLLRGRSSRRRSWARHARALTQVLWARSRMERATRC